MNFRRNSDPLWFSKFETGERLARKIDRFGTRRYWASISRSDSRRATKSGLASKATRLFTDKKASVATSSKLVQKTAFTALSGVLLFVLCEAVGWMLFALAPAPLSLGGQVLDTQAWTNLVAALSGAIAAFLGLFYATVGIVASTVYQSAPGEIRSLFVEERDSSAYVRGVVRALLLGIALLSASALGYEPRAFTIAVFAIMCTGSIAILTFLGRQLFNFFDPSSLAKGLLRSFIGAIRLASQPRTRAAEASQLAAHNDASRVMRLYDQLTQLVLARPIQDPRGPAKLAREVLAAVHVSTQAKTSIPSASRWWSSSQQHQDWLLLNHTERLVAASSPGWLPAKSGPDHLWVERRLLQSLSNAFAALASSPRPVLAVEIADESGPLARAMGQRLQIEEGLLLAEVVASAMEKLVFSTPAQFALTDVEHAAAAERSVLPLQRLWDGLLDASRHASALDLKALLNDESLTSAAYAHTLPRSVLVQIEKFSEALQRERLIEGVRITRPRPASTGRR
jgi:hypothetical protein